MYTPPPYLQDIISGYEYYYSEDNCCHFCYPTMSNDYGPFKKGMTIAELIVNSSDGTIEFRGGKEVHNSPFGRVKRFTQIWNISKITIEKDVNGAPYEE